MKTAYLINGHKNMKQISRLAHRIHTEDSHVFIHIDKKVPLEEYEYLHSLVSDLEHCYISKTRINGRLDNRSLVDIVFALIFDVKQVAQQKGIHYSYYSHMSGQDYLIKPINTIEKKLEEGYPDIYMLYRDAKSAPFVAAKFNRNKALIGYRDCVLKCKIGIVRRALQGFGVVLRKGLELVGQTAGQRIIKNGWKYYQGSAWWVLPDCVIDAVEKEYRGLTKFSEILLDESTTPEETYFQSMVMHLFYPDLALLNNSSMKIKKRMTYIDFGSITNRPTAFHPYIITMDDYERLCESDCWYARKFDETVDGKIIDKIDATLL